MAQKKEVFPEGCGPHHIWSLEFWLGFSALPRGCLIRKQGSNCPVRPFHFSQLNYGIPCFSLTFFLSFISVKGVKVSGNPCVLCCRNTSRSTKNSNPSAWCLHVSSRIQLMDQAHLQVFFLQGHNHEQVWGREGQCWWSFYHHFPGETAILWWQMWEYQEKQAPPLPQSVRETPPYRQVRKDQKIFWGQVSIHSKGLPRNESLRNVSAQLPPGDLKTKGIYLYF